MPSSLSSDRTCAGLLGGGGGGGGGGEGRTGVACINFEHDIRISNTFLLIIT